MIKLIFFYKLIWGSKNPEFDADFESVEKVAKKLMQKSFWLLLLCVFPPITFWVNLFCTFLRDSKSALNFAFYDNNIELFLLILELFANFKAKIGRSGLQYKYVLYNVS